jgi:arabinose-5-phosphate isomerase
MGDALAVVLANARNFTKEDFAKSHPGGLLGRRLLLTVDDIMHTGDDIPRVFKNMTISRALLEITAKKLGMTTVVDDLQKLVGIFTDGDLRRILDKNMDLHTVKIGDVTVGNCKTVKTGILAWDALCMMEQYNITSLVVLNQNNNLAGVIHMHDILKAGLRK